MRPAFCCTMCASFKSIALVSREEKRAQMLVEKWNKKKKKKKIHNNNRTSVSSINQSMNQLIAKLMVASRYQQQYRLRVMYECVECVSVLLVSDARRSFN